MSAGVRVRGTLSFQSESALQAALEFDEDDEAAAEIAELVRASVTCEGTSLRVDLEGSFTNDGNLEFQTWLEDVAEAATQGHLDTWQESFGDEMFVRLAAGGEESEIDGPFPTE